MSGPTIDARTALDTMSALALWADHHGDGEVTVDSVTLRAWLDAITREMERLRTRVPAGESGKVLVRTLNKRKIAREDGAVEYWDRALVDRGPWVCTIVRKDGAA